ncbi:YqeG family HAD IIIA-type phosphatase [Deinococcus misasensis]|uniref:YqeG family HAD IIIA-type phosphatase n=1 Tax=Deinococcus misasensis TaxID=392413 RepID=UPI000B203668|nr:YqeG family HAD IIIA-type phosphatase [Deinococcus misasensis]
MKRIFKPLKPTLMVRHVTELSPEFLNDWGIKGLILDLDNTLVPYKSNETASEIQEWVQAMHASDVKLYMVSNALHERVDYWVKKFLFPGVGLAAKPLPKFFRRALRALDLPPEEVAMVGDQLFTDVLGGNLAGMRTVMVTPLSDNALPHTKVTRKLERLVLHFLKENAR